MMVPRIGHAFPQHLWLLRSKTLLTIRPERWWTFADEGEVKRNFDGGSKKCWRANRFSELAKGTKDSSNYLVAGSFRSFPQDSREKVFKQLSSVKRMNSWSWKVNFYTDYQTLNGLVRSSGVNALSPVKWIFLWWAVFGKQNWRCGMNRKNG